MAGRKVGAIRKFDLDRMAAQDLGYPKPLVSKITQAFLDALCVNLVHHHIVHLDRVGRFIVQKRRGGAKNLVDFDGNVLAGDVPDKVHVNFRKAPALRAMLQRHFQGVEYMDQDNENNEGIEKYGVDEATAHDQERLEKQAAKGCPECGAHLIKQGSVLLCPTHGSEPFEH